MKIQKALKIGNNCGLETVGEAILNIKIHAISLFDDSNKELNELNKTWRWIKEHRRTHDGQDKINEDTKIKLMLDYHIAEDLTDYEIYQQVLRSPLFTNRLANE